MLIVVAVQHYSSIFITVLMIFIVLTAPPPPHILVCMRIPRNLCKSFVCVCVMIMWKGKGCSLKESVYSVVMIYMHNNQRRRKDFLIGGAQSETTHKVVSNLYNNL